MQLALFDERGRQLKGWTNKLIWGDNKTGFGITQERPAARGD